MAIKSITRISADAAGVEGIGFSRSPVFSPDGSKVAFESGASNLVPGDTNGQADIFVKELATGAIARISTSAFGVQGNDGSSRPVFSPDGSKVAFQSYASNLVPGDTNGAIDIFGKDLATGAIARISTSAAGVEGDRLSYVPVFSPDGSKVAFQSAASNLVPGDTNGVDDIFVKDLTTGAIARISTSASGVEGKGDGNMGPHGSSYPVFSPDGSKVAFESDASNLVPGDTNGAIDIFVKDLATGAIARISTSASGVQGNGGSGGSPVFSPDGSKVAFLSHASNLVPGDTNGTWDIFVKDLATGAIARISTSASGVQSNGGSFITPVFSPDGSKVAFSSGASDLVPGDTNADSDIFVKDVATGAIARISTSAAGVEGDGWSWGPVFSPDGSKVAFQSYASNLVPGDTNGTWDIFVKDLATGAIARISPDAPGVLPGESLPPIYSLVVFSSDGSKIAFESYPYFSYEYRRHVNDIFVVELDDAWVSPPVVTWSIAPQSVSVDEGVGTVDFTLSRSGSTAPQTVYLSTVETHGATNEGDYRAKLNEPVVFAAGELSKTVSVTIIDDAIAGESDETFGVIIQALPADPPTEFLAATAFTIEDNDAVEPVNPIIGTARSDRLIGTDGNDIIRGLAGIDWLEGKGGNDVLLGGPGSDWLDGGDGDDILIGGKGIDMLIGGRGADLFVINALSSAPDMIFDFTPSEGDRLGLGPLIDSLGLRGQSDVDALVGVVRVGQNIAVTLDTNGAAKRDGVKFVALLLQPEITDPQQILAFVDTDTLVLDHGDYWG